jgi:hypothetical protein
MYCVIAPDAIRNTQDEGRCRAGIALHSVFPVLLYSVSLGYAYYLPTSRAPALLTTSWRRPLRTS